MPKRKRSEILEELASERDIACVDARAKVDELTMLLTDAEEQYESAKESADLAEVEYKMYMTRIAFWRRATRALNYKELPPVLYADPNELQGECYGIYSCNGCEEGEPLGLFVSYDFAICRWKDWEAGEVFEDQIPPLSRLPPVCATCKTKLERRWQTNRDLLSRIENGEFLTGTARAHFIHRLPSVVKRHILRFVSDAFC